MHKWLSEIVFPLYLAFSGYTISSRSCFSEPLALPLRRLVLLSAERNLRSRKVINVVQTRNVSLACSLLLKEESLIFTYNIKINNISLKV